MRLLKRLIHLFKCSRIVGYRKVLAYTFMPAGKMLYVNVADTELLVRARSSDLQVAITSLIHEYAFLDDLLPEDYDGLIVDAGGYIGTAAIAFARRFPDAKVVTIEPSLCNFEVLQKNISEYNNIITCRAALSVKGEGEISLRNRGTGHWGYTIVEHPRDNKEAIKLETVPLISLDQIMYDQKEKIGFLKLDIEGGEKEIFDEGSEALKVIPLIFVELHDRIVEGCRDAFQAFSIDRWMLRLGGEKYIAIRKHNTSN